MKAKDLLKEIVKAYPDVVAIAQDKYGDTYCYFDEIPVTSQVDAWDNINSKSILFDLSRIIEWDFKSWKKRIVTINDLKNEKSQ